jgi:hypothetical protein
MNNDLIHKSFNKAIGGGLSGSMAMATQVTTLMWLRTIMNYQYVNGTTFKSSFKTLYKDGGLLRLYRGYPIAIVNAPLFRFGDTAANIGILEVTKNLDLPIYIKTGIASMGAASWRMILMPLDTLKLNYQVNGNLNILKTNINSKGYKVLYNGTFAAFSSTLIGHYPWFVTYNYLTHYFPESKEDSTLDKLTKRATIGLGASVISDTSSNFIRVIKTIKQTSGNTLSYNQTVKYLYEKEGYSWIFRGLKTKIMTNSINGIMFSITWKYYQDLFNKNED